MMDEFWASYEGLKLNLEIEDFKVKLDESYEERENNGFHIENEELV